MKKTIFNKLYNFKLFLSGSYNIAGVPEILEKLYNYIKEKGLKDQILLSSSMDIYKQFLRIYLSSLVQYIYNFNKVFISIKIKSTNALKYYII